MATFKVTIKARRKNLGYYEAILTPMFPYRVTKYALPMQTVRVEWEVVHYAHSQCEAKDTIQVWSVPRPGSSEEPILHDEESTRGRPKGEVELQLPGDGYAAVYFAYMRAKNRQNCYAFSRKTPNLPLFTSQLRAQDRRTRLELREEDDNYIDHLKDGANLTTIEEKEARYQITQWKNLNEVNQPILSELEEALSYILRSYLDDPTNISVDDIKQTLSTYAELEAGQIKFDEATSVLQRAADASQVYRDKFNQVITSKKQILADDNFSSIEWKNLHKDHLKWVGVSSAEVQAAIDMMRKAPYNVFLKQHTSEGVYEEETDLESDQESPDQTPQYDEYGYLIEERIENDDTKRNSPLSESSTKVNVCNQSDNLILFEGGTAFACGAPYPLSKKSLQPLVHPILTPLRVNFKSKISIAQISCGHQFSVAITTTGKVYGWGANNCGQLGQVSSLDPHRTPQLVRKIDEACRYIAAGHSHALAISTSGDLWSWGASTSGELGRYVRGRWDATPEKLKKKDVGGSVLDAACGHRFSLIINESGQVWSFGSKKNLQLGYDKPSQFPKQVEALGHRKFKKVACGYNFSAAISESGELFTWGANFYGQLGQGTERGNLCLEPAQVCFGNAVTDHKHTEDKKEQIVSVDASPNPLHGHMICVTKSGRVYGWGSNYANCLGLGLKKNEAAVQFSTPQPIYHINSVTGSFDGQPIQVSCGGLHACLLTDSGNLYSWGSGRNGVLCLTSPIGLSTAGRHVYNEPLPRLVKSFQRNIKQISCNYYHTAFVAEANSSQSTADTTDTTVVSDRTLPLRDPSLSPLTFWNNHGGYEPSFK